MKKRFVSFPGKLVFLGAVALLLAGPGIRELQAQFNNPPALYAFQARA